MEVRRKFYEIVLEIWVRHNTGSLAYDVVYNVEKFYPETLDGIGEHESR
jgi:hypothetical protein